MVLGFLGFLFLAALALAGSRFGVPGPASVADAPSFTLLRVTSQDINFGYSNMPAFTMWFVDVETGGRYFFRGFNGGSDPSYGPTFPPLPASTYALHVYTDGGLFFESGMFPAGTAGGPKFALGNVSSLQNQFRFDYENMPSFSVEFFDVSAKTSHPFRDFSAGSGSHQAALPDLPAGTYALRVYTGGALFLETHPFSLPTLDASLQLTLASFDSGAGLVGQLYRPTPPPCFSVSQRFGWSDTSYAGGGRGEIGGVVSKGFTPAYYAVSYPAVTNWNSRISFETKIANRGGESEVYIGFFNPSTLKWRPANFLGLRID